MLAAGDVATAAAWNVLVGNDVAFSPVLNAWTSWTPQVDQGANLNIAKTVQYAKYLQIGKTVTASMRLDMTGAGASGFIKVSLPVTAASATYYNIGSSYFFDASGPLHYVLAVIKIDASSMVFVHDTSTSNYFGAVPAILLASGDSLNASITYEAA